MALADQFGLPTMIYKVIRLAGKYSKVLLISSFPLSAYKELMFPDRPDLG